MYSVDKEKGKKKEDQANGFFIFSLRCDWLLNNIGSWGYKDVLGSPSRFQRTRVANGFSTPLPSLTRRPTDRAHIEAECPTPQPIYSKR